MKNTPFSSPILQTSPNEIVSPHKVTLNNQSIYVSPTYASMLEAINTNPDTPFVKKCLLDSQLPCFKLSLKPKAPSTPTSTDKQEPEGEAAGELFGIKMPDKAARSPTPSPIGKSEGVCNDSKTTPNPNEEGYGPEPMFCTKIKSCELNGCIVYLENKVPHIVINQVGLEAILWQFDTPSACAYEILFTSKSILDTKAVRRNNNNSTKEENIFNTFFQTPTIELYR